MSPSDREFSHKLALLLIDKVLVGVFFVLLGFFIQSTLEQQRAALAQQQAEQERLTAERERIRDVTLEFSRVLTRIVAVHRQTIVTAVHDLLAILNEYESLGRVQESNDRERLRSVVEGVENAIGQLARANPGLPVVADPFVRLTRRIRSDLVNRPRGREAFRADARDLLESYTTLLIELRATSVRAMEDDRRAVSDILASGDL